MNVRIPRIRPAQAGWYGLVAAAGLLSLMAVVSLASRTGPTDELTELLEEFQPTTQPAATTEDRPERRPRRASGDGSDRQAIEQISQRNIFAPPAGPKKPPVPVAVLGDQAVFPNDKWIRVGEEHEGFKLLAIGPDWVEMDVDGKAVRVSVFAKEGAEGRAAEASVAAEPQPPSDERRERQRRFPGPPFEVTPEMIERFRAMPPERRERILERMPPELREQLSP